MIQVFSKKRNILGNEKGAVFITGLLIVLVLTVLGTAAMMSTATELKIASNDRSAKRAFYLAEAGLEDARSWLQLGASASPISDNHPTNTAWEAFEGAANYPYSVFGQTLTGMNWGSPMPGATLQDPTSCSEHNIVHFNTNGTFVRIRGGSSGCGLLLVEGDLAVEGGFQWYGAILVTGTITFTGGGGKNVTGGVLAGESVSADLVGGDANLVYCGAAIDNQTNLRPLLVLRWVEMFS